MSIDLETSLAELARSVHDDAVATRMSGQVRHMVTRIRRRRAARHAATGVLSVGTLAAAVVGGLHLADRSGAPLPPAGTSSPSTPLVFQIPECGDPTTESPGPGGPTVSAELPAAVALGTELEATLRIDAHGAEILGSAGTAWVARDGVVVSTSLGVAEATLEEGAERHRITASLVSCDTGEPLSPGDYQMYFGQQVMTSESNGWVDVTSGPWPFVIGPDDRAELAEQAEQFELQAQLDALLAQPPSSDPFPSCGSAVPDGDDLPLALDLTLAEQVYPAGELVQTQATVHTTAGRTVIANAPTSGALIVLVRDGVVVGRGYWDPEDVDILDLGPDDTQVVPAIGRLSLCTTPLTEAGGPDLPDGAYQAYAVMEVMLKEITEASGDAYSITELIAARSAPVDITVG